MHLNSSNAQHLNTPAAINYLPVILFLTKYAYVGPLCILGSLYVIAMQL